MERKMYGGFGLVLVVGSDERLHHPEEQRQSLDALVLEGEYRLVADCLQLRHGSDIESLQETLREQDEIALEVVAEGYPLHYLSRIDEE